MDARLDPACERARALVKDHRDQEALLVAGSGGQLAAIVRTTQEKQVNDHLVQCARCRHYDPRCSECGFDLRRERHGWMCPQQASRWTDVLPWNWRAKKAPPLPPGTTWRHVGTPTPARASAPPPARRVEVAQQVQLRGASSAPKPRARPQAPRPDALAVAYASLGLSADAGEDAVRSAYRARAQQYHPDKVAHMAPEFRAVAEKKMVEINGAYERIKRSW
jgi:hypothetical protein